MLKLNFLAVFFWLVFFWSNKKMLVLSACEKIKFLSQNNSKKNLKTDTVKSVSV